MSKPTTIPEIQSRLEMISQEMISIIQKYQLDAQDPLDVIPVARRQITDDKDYVRFLELSLEGRLLGESAEHLEANDANGQ